MLKWAICQRHGIIYLEDLPDQKLAERVTGSRGHDLNFLLESSGLLPLLKLNKTLYKSFVLVSKWSVTLRYEPQAGNAITALRFLADVRAIRDWLEQI